MPPRRSERFTPASESSDEESVESRGNTPFKARANYLIDESSSKGLRTQAVSRFKHLLGLSDLFRHFVDLRAQRDTEFQSILDDAEKANRKHRSSTSGRRNRQFHRQPSEEDNESNMLDDDSDDELTVFTESPAFIEGKLRDYQIDGLNWMISLYQNSLSGILADEMGLGKTLQTISFLTYLREVRKIVGPYLIIVPKSTVDNWAREFAKWSPKFNVLVLSGDKQTRADLVRKRLKPCDFDVCITSFELVIREKAALKRFAWQYLVVDEAHRIKNEESILSRIVRLLFSRNRLLITGTPLQNNLHELWALLNFLLPDVFADSEVFDEWFQSENEDQERVVEQLHRLLRPFLLRRVKNDVERSLLPKKEINLYVGMTDMQIQWYQKLLEKDLEAINGNDKRSGESKMRLLNVVMQLRKCCNHPYLFEGAEPGPPFTTDEHIVTNSAKMVVLDKLLHRLKEQGSRVLIFSQMSRMLDILEDYCSFRDYEYCRIDGSTEHEDRVEAIDEFNKPGSDRMIFLLTTRAGGLGINLTTADQVVLYDSDWNPQADLQAMDRAHRIGQTKQVVVYRFVTENAIEEKVLERAAQKLRLDQLVIQQGRSSQQDKAKQAASKEDLVDMIRHGAQNVFDQNKGTFVDQSIEDIIRNGESRTKELNIKYSALGLDELQKFTVDHPTQAIVSRNQASAEGSDNEHVRHRRERKELIYSADGLEKVRLSRPPRQVPIVDYQFFPPELEQLQEKEMTYYRKQVGVRVSPEDFSDEDEEACEQMNREIEAAEPLTEEEQAHKEELVNEGFPMFTKRDFHHFLHLAAKHGRDGIDAIVQEWSEKDEPTVRRYHKVFFERFKELADHERYMAQIEAGESRSRKQNYQFEILKNKVTGCRAPLSEMQIIYPVSNVRRSYNEDEDRFLLVAMYELGLDTPNLFEEIRTRIRTSGLFDYDWFFMSRSAVEISRRCSTLLLIITREVDGPSALKRKSRKEAVESDEEGDETPRRRGRRKRVERAATEEVSE